jgi:hypothetical protein
VLAEPDRSWVPAVWRRARRDERDDRGERVEIAADADPGRDSGAAASAAGGSPAEPSALVLRFDSRRRVLASPG